MQSKETYKDINDTIRKLRIQIMDGVHYAQTECPQFDTPKEAFDWLLQRTKYTKDPKGTELLQCLPTLLDDNEHGVTGAGDCDCFTIGILTLLVANGLYENCGIVLAGRNRFVPVHIYAYTTDDNGKEIILDLTNKIYDLERFYPYTQRIQLIINPLEEKKMFLQLAEGGDYLSKGGHKKRQHKRELKKDLKFKQKEDDLKTQYDTSVPDISPTVDNSYTYLPQSDMHVRNDVYDDMDDSEFQNTMLEEGVSPHKILELSGARAARKMVKAKGKAGSKMVKANSKANTKQIKASSKQRISGDAKANLFSKLTDVGGSLVSKFTGTPMPNSGGYNVSSTDGSNMPTPANGNGFLSGIPKPVKIIGAIGIAAVLFMTLKPKHKTA